MNREEVLITGGTGSFGQYMTRHLMDTGKYRVKIFSRDEQKQEEMRRTYGNKNIEYVIGDVRDYQSVKDATEGIDIVLHASALDNGEDILYHSEGNQVIHHKGVFYVVKDSEVKTVYTRTIYVEARPRIVRGWEADSNGK